LIDLFVCAEEESPVASVIYLRNSHRTAYIEAILVVVQRRFRLGGRIEKVVRIEGCVLDVVVSRAVELIGAVFADQIDVNAKVGSVLSGVVAALHLNFRNHVGAGTCRCYVAQIVHDGDAVERLLILRLTLSGADEIHAWWIAGVACLASNDDIGGQGCFLQCVMPLNWKILYLAGCDGFTQRSVVGRHRRRVRSHRN